MLYLDLARWVCMIIRVKPQECGWLQWSETISIDQERQRTSRTDGTRKFGTPLAKLP